MNRQRRWLAWSPSATWQGVSHLWPAVHRLAIAVACWNILGQIAPGTKRFRPPARSAAIRNRMPVVRRMQSGECGTDLCSPGYDRRSTRRDHRRRIVQIDSCPVGSDIVRGVGAAHRLRMAALAGRSRSRRAKEPCSALTVELPQVSPRLSGRRPGISRTRNEIWRSQSRQKGGNVDRDTGSRCHAKTL
jgi:hypothetical protein